MKTSHSINIIIRPMQPNTDKQNNHKKEEYSSNIVRNTIPKKKGLIRSMWTVGIVVLVQF